MNDVTTKDVILTGTLTGASAKSETEENKMVEKNLTDILREYATVLQKIMLTQERLIEHLSKPDAYDKCLLVEAQDSLDEAIDVFHNGL